MKIIKSFVITVLFFTFLFLFPIKALAVTATGAWSSGDAYVTCGGTINCTFPAEGGSASGTYSGICDKQNIKLGGRFSGNFTGGWDGTFSGSFSGWHSYVVNDEQHSFNLQGSWRGSVRKDGTVTVNFTSGSDLGLDGDVFATFSVDKFENELEKELNKSGVVITGDGKREPWSTNVIGMNNAYVIVDGERQPFVDGMELQPGMTVGTEGEDGLLVFTTASGEHIRLQGDGTRVTLMTTDTVADEQWKEILDQLTERREEGSGSFDRSNPNMLKRRTPVTVMHSGQMVVKYETGDGKEGWWNAAFKSDHEEYSDVSSVMFSRNIYSDYRGETVTGIEDSDPVELAFENHSIVEYLYEGDEITVKVYEGEAVGYRINLKTGENEEVARVKEGESLTISVDKYRVGTADTGLVKGEFDLSQEPEGVTELKKLSRNKTVVSLLIGGAILGGLVFLVLYILKKKK